MTNQTNNGNSESKVDDKLQEAEAVLLDYEKSLGIVPTTVMEETSSVINLRAEQIRKLSAEECGEHAFILSQQSLFIQHQINKHNQRINWASSNIDAIISGRLDNYGSQYTPFADRKIMAILDNEYTKKLHEIKTKSQQVIHRLEYIPARINYMCKTLLELQQTKRSSYV
jgi:predicted class III extradiol MEMO1 family dioxygenase